MEQSLLNERHARRSAMKVLCKNHASYLILEDIMQHTTPRMLALALTATAVLGFSGVALAWHGGPGYNDRGSNQGCYGMQNSTPEQQAAAQKLFDEFQTSTDSVRQQLVVKEAELRAQTDSPSPDAQKIEALSQEIGKLRGQMLAARVGLDAKLRDAGLSAYCGGNGMGNGMGMHHRGYYGNGHGRGYGHRGAW